MLVLLARGDQWNAWQSLLKQVGSILNDPRTEKNPKAPPNCQYVEVDDRQGFQHPVPKGCTAGIHAGCGFHWQEELINYLNAPVHPRQVLWYVDEAGNQGKSWMASYLSSTKNAFVVINFVVINFSSTKNAFVVIIKHENGNTPLMIAAWRGNAAVATLLLAARDDIDVQSVDLDTAIITTVPIGAQCGNCKGRRLGVWLKEDVHREADNEEEEEEEDTSDVDSVEEDQDEEEEQPLND